MLSDFLKKHITSQASYVDYGYGQVEPNHLSAQYSKEVYAQLPAAADIEVLENGQFAKYDYANGVVNFDGKGEWMLVFNEIKLYREEQDDCEFAMVKGNYLARVYSPFGYALDKDGNKTVDDDLSRQSRYYNGLDDQGNDSITLGDNTYKYGSIIAPEDYYEIHYTDDPYHIFGPYKEAMMPEGTTMVPRLLKTHIGDIFTTNMINADELALGDTLVVGDKGILEPGEDEKFCWQVVKVYTMPDHQKGVKIMRIA